MALHFERKEFANRMQLVTAAMKQQGLEAMLLFLTPKHVLANWL